MTLPSPHNPRQIDPALLTAGEYLKIVDPQSKYHEASSYDFDLAKMNSYGGDPKEYPRLIRRLKVAGLDIEVRLKSKPCRYVKVDPDGALIRGADGMAEYFTEAEAARMGKALEEHTIAVFHDGQRIGLIEDEWGCVLVVIAREYRGLGLGTFLHKLARTLYPDKPSGGFTPYGYAGFHRVHRQFVRDALADGRYSRLVRTGTLTMERVREITDSAKLRGTPPQRETTANFNASNPKDWLLYVGEYGDFVLYDRKLREMVEEGGEQADFFMDRMILGAVNVRALDTRDGEYGILTLFGATTPKLRAFLMKVALSYCAEEKLTLLVDDGDDLRACDPAFAERIGQPDLRSGWRRQEVRLRGEPLPYAAIGLSEKAFRRSFDRYQEFQHRIMEMGHSKFRPAAA